MPKKIVVDPRIWEDLEGMSPEAKAEFHRMLEMFQQAAANVAEDASEEEFNAELERISGCRTRKVDPDTLSDEELEQLEKRWEPVSKH